jgi:hypothetical protein
MPSCFSAPFLNDSNGTDKLILAHGFHGFMKLPLNIGIKMFCQGILFEFYSKRGSE